MKAFSPVVIVLAAVVSLFPIQAESDIILPPVPAESFDGEEGEPDLRVGMTVCDGILIAVAVVAAGVAIWGFAEVIKISRE